MSGSGRAYPYAADASTKQKLTSRGGRVGAKKTCVSNSRIGECLIQRPNTNGIRTVNPNRGQFKGLNPSNVVVVVEGLDYVSTDLIQSRFLEQQSGCFHDQSFPHPVGNMKSAQVLLKKLGAPAFGSA